jgi:hypothetical protein
MYRLEFEIPGLPRMANLASGKSHWRHAHNEAKKWKALTAAAVRIAGKPHSPLAHAALVLTRYSSVPPDPDGLVRGFKHVLDGLVESGVLENDKLTNIGMPEFRWEKCKPKQGKLRVVVEERVSPASVEQGRWEVIERE